MALAECAFGGFANRCKSFREQIVKTFTFFVTFFILIRFEPKRIIRHFLKLRLKRINALDQRT